MKILQIRYLGSLIIGIILGFISSFVISIGWFSLIPWGIVGLVLGYYSKKQARIITGILYGFSLCFTFMVANYSGAQPIINAIPFFTLIGLIGSFFGVLLSFTGSFIQVQLPFNSIINNFRLSTYLKIGGEDMLKTKNILIIISSVFLLFVNWLAFHDFQEVHTTRDWLMLLASILVFIQFGKDLWSPHSPKQLK